MLEILTFTGIDQETDLDHVEAIQGRHPSVEFAVLIGSQTGGSNPIFPPMKVIRNVKRLPGRKALHLCGVFARSAVDGYGPQLDDLANLVQGFDRVQINIHADGIFPPMPNALDTGYTRTRAPFAAFLAATDCQVILQHREPWETAPYWHDRVEYLFDRSEGGGREFFNEWPPPPKDGKRWGYAGGMGPANIGTALAFVKQHSGARLWLDMERNVRSSMYFLDLGKVQDVCRQVFQNPEQK